MIFNMQSGGVVPDQYLDAQIITPGTTNQVIDAGTYLRGAQTILGDPDLVPANIPIGINLFGVEGTKPLQGLYVWKKYASKGGTFLDYIVDDVSNRYPDSGTSGGYYYEKIASSAAQYGVFFDRVIDGIHPEKIDYIFPQNADFGIGRYDANWTTDQIKNFIGYAKEITISTGALVHGAFASIFSNFGGKLKVKATKITQGLNFKSIGTSDSNLENTGIKRAVFLSSEITEISLYSPSATYSPFYLANANTKLYCEPASIPAGWTHYFNSYGSTSKLTTMWGVSESQFDAL